MNQLSFQVKPMNMFNIFLVKLALETFFFHILNFLRIDWSRPRHLRCQIKFSLLHQISDFKFLSLAKILKSDHTLEKGTFINDVTKIWIGFKPFFPLHTHLLYPLWHYMTSSPTFSVIFIPFESYYDGIRFKHKIPSYFHFCDLINCLLGFLKYSHYWNGCYWHAFFILFWQLKLVSTFKSIF